MPSKSKPKLRPTITLNLKLGSQTPVQKTDSHLFWRKLIAEAKGENRK